MPVAAATTRTRLSPESAITRLPEWSTATPHVDRLAPVALRPSPSGPAPPVPAGVVSRPVPGLTFRTDPPLAMYRCPAPNDTPHGDERATLVALAGPPTPPATVEITPAVLATVDADAGPAAPDVAGASRAIAALATTTARWRTVMMSCFPRRASRRMIRVTGLCGE